jgi:hypothetical protein
MKAIRKIRTPVVALGSLFLFSGGAQAASRTVYFNATGTNRTSEGLSENANSTCTIVVTNPSSASQTFTLKTTVQAINEFDGSHAFTTSGISVSQAGCTVTGCASEIALSANGGSVTITFTYKTFPKRPSTTQYTHSQTLRCTGSITAKDVSASAPGYVVASGTLNTFIESAKMHTDSATSESTNLFGGVAVWTQIPIAINRGKPF